MSLSLLKPVLQAILACFLWGIVFAMPVYLDSFSSLDIILGRFFIYGALSCLVLIYYIVFKKETDILNYCKQASFCAVIMNLIYFTSLTFGARLTAPSIITLIIGVGPITITVASCLLKKDYSLLSLFFLPSVAIFFGLCLMSIEALKSDLENLSVNEHIQGIVFGIIALSSWTWYVLYNAETLKKNTSIDPVAWTALIGTITFGFTVFGSLIYYFSHEKTYFYQFSWNEESGKLFWQGVAILGIFCSWIAFTLWNMAGAKLPAALSGQLSILETFFGVSLIYFLLNQTPTISEIVGILFIFFGVSFGLYSYAQKDKKEALKDF